MHLNQFSSLHYPEKFLFCALNAHPASRLCLIHFNIPSILKMCVYVSVYTCLRAKLDEYLLNEIDSDIYYLSKLFILSELQFIYLQSDSNIY